MAESKTQIALTLRLPQCSTTKLSTTACTFRWSLPPGTCCLAARKHVLSLIVAFRDSHVQNDAASYGGAMPTDRLRGSAWTRDEGARLAKRTRRAGVHCSRADSVEKGARARRGGRLAACRLRRTPPRHSRRGGSRGGPRTTPSHHRVHRDAVRDRARSAPHAGLRVALSSGKHEERLSPGMGLQLAARRFDLDSTDRYRHRLSGFALARHARA